ncbi:MAG: amidohydrolase family protein [Pseudomonadota bacterium]
MANRPVVIVLLGATLMLPALLSLSCGACSRPRQEQQQQQQRQQRQQPAGSKSNSQQLPPIEKIDAHAHFGPRSIPRLIEILDRQGIKAIVNFSGGFPGGGLEEQLAAASLHPDRIYVFATLDWRQPFLGPGYGARMAASLELAKRLGARGLKIDKGLGLAFGDWTRRLIAVDAPELDVVFDTAGRLGMPVAIHSGDPVAFFSPPTPDNERIDELSVHPQWSFYGRPVPQWEEIFAALERRIARHPGTKFVSVHFGNAAEYPDRVATLLDRYPNLHIDTAARIPEFGRHPAAKMHAFFVRFAGRILFGTDLGVGSTLEETMLGSSGVSPPTAADIDHFYAATWRYFETSDLAFPHPTPIQGRWTIDGIELEEPVLRKIYEENTRLLLGIPRNVAERIPEALEVTSDQIEQPL